MSVGLCDSDDCLLRYKNLMRTLGQKVVGGRRRSSARPGRNPINRGRATGGVTKTPNSLYCLRFCHTLRTPLMDKAFLRIGSRTSCRWPRTIRFATRATGKLACCCFLMLSYSSEFTGNSESLPPRLEGGAAISIAASRVRIRIVRTLRLSEDRAYTETVESQKQTYSQHQPLHDKTPFVNVRAPSPQGDGRLDECRDFATDISFLKAHNLWRTRRC